MFLKLAQCWTSLLDDQPVEGLATATLVLTKMFFYVFVMVNPRLLQAPKWKLYF